MVTRHNAGVLSVSRGAPGFSVQTRQSFKGQDFRENGFAFSCLCCRVLGSPKSVDSSGKGSSLPKQERRVGERRQEWRSELVCTGEAGRPPGSMEGHQSKRQVAATLVPRPWGAYCQETNLACVICNVVFSRKMLSFCSTCSPSCSLVALT